jgi:hypothetical protein
VFHHIQVGNRLNAASVMPLGAVADIAIDRSGIGPVRFDGNDRESMLGDESARDRRAGLVELGRAVTGFAEKHHAMRSLPVERSAESRIRKEWQFLSCGGEHLRPVRMQPP